MPHTTRSRRLAQLATITTLGALALPALAHADSIVYLDGGNVWSSRPDGAGKVQLTDGGDWHSPTQADDGTIAAVKGTGPIHVLNRDGRPLRTITTAPAPTANGGTFAPRPVELAFSPDGTKIAYSYIAGSCPVASTCNEQTSTFYTRSDVDQATPQDVWGNQYGASHAEWVTNDRTVVQNAAKVALDDLGGGDYSFRTWIAEGEDFGDPETSRDGTRLATTFSYGQNTRVAFMAVTGDPRQGDPPQNPEVVCATQDGDPQNADPTWSLDGTGVAFASSKGISVIRFSSFAPGSCGASAPFILAATGKSPDWGPADPPAARWTPPTPAPAPTPGPGATPGGKTPTTPGTTAALRIKTGAVNRKSLRAGLKVRVTVPKAGRVQVTLRNGRKVLARGSATAKRPGPVVVRLSKTSRRSAAAARGKQLTLTATAPGARAQKLTVRAR